MLKKASPPKENVEITEKNRVRQLARADFFIFLKKDLDKRGAGFAALSRSWENLLGERAAYGRPERIEKRGAENILVILSDRRFSAEAGYLKKEYLQKINLFLGGCPHIGDIVFINGLKLNAAPLRTDPEVPTDPVFLHAKRKEMLGLSFKSENLQKTLEALAEEMICREYRETVQRRKIITSAVTTPNDWRMQAKKMFRNG